MMTMTYHLVAIALSMTLSQLAHAENRAPRASSAVESATRNAAELSTTMNALNDSLIETARSMIPLTYAAPALATACGIPRSKWPEKVRKQMESNDRMVSSLPEEARPGYNDAVATFVSSFRDRWGSLSADRRAMECADVR